MFKNMPKTMRDSLTAKQSDQRLEAIQILLMNISLCHLKTNNTIDAVKTAKEAVEQWPENPKALYRLANAQRLNGDFEPAKETIVKAIKLDPGNKTLREEHKTICDIQKAKHRERFERMNGFYQSEKMREVEKQADEEELLKEKLRRK
jgi:Flp pilus assembly protein TadD